MLLVYTEKTSPRLQYICRFIFEELLQTTFSLTLHEESFEAHPGPKINYSDKHFHGAYHILPHSLLFETGINTQEISCTGIGEELIFFQTAVGTADHSFDIFSAAFYLLSRYEEYLPHEKDLYGRYAHENSMAYQNGFLKIPLVNIWANRFGKKLQTFFPSFIIQDTSFSFQPTYDIDMAWSYRQKGLLRNAAGFIRKPSLGRISALLGIQDDPFDSYDFLDELHAAYGQEPLYFFLVAKENSVYDKNILPENEAMQKLIKAHSEKYRIGLHPSWKSNEQQELLFEEKSTLENISGKPVSFSRQHYIKNDLPQTYQSLIAAGITADHSMGYGSINGFRASTASSFFWYDLSNEKVTALQVRPFCFMDANCFYEQKLSPEDSFDELMHFYFECKKVNGTLITVFHNNFLGSDRSFAGWRELYEKFIAHFPKQGANVS